RGLVVAAADDLECLNQRDARGEHGRQLTAEHRNIFRFDLTARLECRRLLLDPGGDDALAPQIGLEGLLVGRNTASLEFLALLVHAFPLEGDVLADRTD